MQRLTTILFGLALALAMAFVLTGTKRAGPAQAPAASLSNAAPPPPVDDRGKDAGAPQAKPDESALEAALEGESVPELPADAPKQVRLGVILFTYAGAEGAPKGARSKAEALKLAKQTVEEAKQDFAEATKKGDRGSIDDAGLFPRGFLEPNLEYIVFTLEKGAVFADPIETPRGYWIVRRK